MTKTFTGAEDWEATWAAESWCEENGINVGAMQGDSPRGLMRGEYYIEKWRNLSQEEIDELDGAMTGNPRHGPITIEIKDAD